MTTNIINAAELDLLLHDAEIDLEQVHLDDSGRLTLTGTRFMLDARRRTAKQTFQIVVHGVLRFDLVDEARVGVLPVEAISPSGNQLIIVGAIPVSLDISFGDLAERAYIESME